MRTRLGIYILRRPSSGASFCSSWCRGESHDVQIPLGSCSGHLPHAYAFEGSGVVGARCPQQLENVFGRCRHAFSSPLKSGLVMIALGTRSECIGIRLTSSLGDLGNRGVACGC